MNKIKKIVSRIVRKGIFLLDGVNTKIYMKWYNLWLKNNGLKINGNAKYINHTVILDGQGYYLIELGNDIVISIGTIILVHDFAIETGFKAIGIENGSNEAHTMKKVTIGDNCFIGVHVVILGGTQIGNNCIVAAGSVLPGKTYPDNSIIVGNPGKVVANTIEWAKKKRYLGEYEMGYFS